MNIDFAKVDYSQPKTEALDSKRQEMSDFINTCMLKNNIVLKEAMNRNLIFVGKTRSGKSTALSVLKNPFTFVKISTLFSETYDAKINHFTVEMANAANEKINFNISIIDTPGLFEVKDQGTTRDNDALEEIVLKCMKEEITKINSIFFVVAYGSSGINPQDIESLQAFIKLFEGAEKHVHVLITKCEKLKEEDKEKIEAEFRNYPKMKDLLKTVNPKMYFLGAVEQSDYENGFIDSFKLSMNNVLALRQTLFLDIFRNTDSFELNTLKMIDSVRIKSQQLYSDLQVSFQKKDTLAEPDLAILQEGCKRLDSSLPLLDVSAYDNAKKFLSDARSFFKQRNEPAPAAEAPKDEKEGSL